MIRTSTRTGNSRETGIKCSPCGPRPSCFSYVTCAGELRCRFIKWSARNMTAKEANRSDLQATLRYSLTEGLPTIHLQPDMASHIAVSGPQDGDAHQTQLASRGSDAKPLSVRCG